MKLRVKAKAFIGYRTDDHCIRQVFNDDSAYGACVWASAFITTCSPILSQVAALLDGHQVPKRATALPALPLDGRILHTKGQVSSVDVADLLSIKQMFKGYEGADMVYVENVLKGENKQRTHTQTTNTETTVSVETEKTTTQEQELTLITRFEMNKEVPNTSDEDLKAKLKTYDPAERSWLKLLKAEVYPGALGEVEVDTLFPFPPPTWRRGKSRIYRVWDTNMSTLLDI